MKKNYHKKKMILMILTCIAIALAGYVSYEKFIKTQMMIADISPYNFTDVDVVDLFVNGTWGGNSHAHSGGGSSVCCIFIPEKWRPGLVANVKWKKTQDEKWYTAQADIPPYTESGSLQVLFMPGNQIKVYVNDYWPCTPMHPMPKEQFCDDEKKP